MKDDAPSPRARILQDLGGGLHRPCQFEHEITGGAGWNERRRARRGETKRHHGRRVAGGWKVAGLKGGGGWDQLLSFHETDRDGPPRAALLTRRSVTTPRPTSLLGRVPLAQWRLFVGDNSHHLPQPPRRIPGVSRPGNLSRITLIKRFNRPRARSFIDAYIDGDTVNFIKIEGGGGERGNRRLRSALTRPIGNSLLDGRVRCAGLCYNRGWKQSALEIGPTWRE